MGRKRPANESGQVVHFNVSNDNNALFAQQPAIANDGTLTIDSPPGQGTLVVAEIPIA